MRSCLVYDESFCCSVLFSCHGCIGIVFCSTVVNCKNKKTDIEMCLLMKKYQDKHKLSWNLQRFFFGIQERSTFFKAFVTLLRSVLAFQEFGLIVAPLVVSAVIYLLTLKKKQPKHCERTPITRKYTKMICLCSSKL